MIQIDLDKILSDKLLSYSHNETIRRETVIEAMKEACEQTVILADEKAQAFLDARTFGYKYSKLHDAIIEIKFLIKP